MLLVVDGRAGLRAGDAELAKTLRGGDVPVLVVVNKADRPERRAPSPPSSTSSASASRWRSPPPTASAPATCSTAIVELLGDRAQPRPARTTPSGSP